MRKSELRSAQCGLWPMMRRVAVAGATDESDVPQDTSPLSKRDEVVWLDVLDEAASAQGET
eukprot:1855680-Prymnesium_polylepis.1